MKVVVDILFIILYLLSFSSSYINNTIIYKVIIGLLLVTYLLHIYNNRKTFKKIKNKNLKEIIILIIDIVFYLTLLLYIILNLIKNNNLSAEAMNDIGSSIRTYGELSIIIFGLYIFNHFSKKIDKIKLTNLTKTIISIIIIILGIYSFDKLDFVNGLRGLYPIKIQTNIIINMILYLSISIGVSLICYLIKIMIRSIKKEGK